MWGTRLGGLGQCGGEGEGLFGFAEKDAGAGEFVADSVGEWDGVQDLRDIGAAGLLGGLERNATPTVCALGRGEGEVLLCAVGEDGCDACDAELSGLLDGPLEVIEFEDGKQKVDGQGCVGF